MIQAIHVDKDGTFSLSEPRNKRVIEDIAAEHGVYSDLNSEECHKAWKKNLWGMCEGRAEQAIHSILVENFPKSRIDTISSKDFETVCRVIYNARHHEVSIREGMIEELEVHKSRGTKVAMVTSSDLKSTNTDLELAFGSAAKGHSFFDVIVTSDDIKKVSDRKPSPMPFLKSCHALKLAPEWGHVALEDSPTGRDSAIACFGSGSNLIVRFVENDNNDTADHGKLVHAHDMAEASKYISNYDAQLNSTVTNLPQRALK